MNRSSRRINKRKAVPLLYQKSQSNSQFLATANYKHQIKKLKKANKELACSLQDAKCKAADQERALAECNRENTQAMFVKMKIKDIVETVKKLVTDLGDVYDVIDGKTFDFLSNCSASHQEARLKISHPNVSTIEESSMSTIDPDFSKEESLCVENSATPAKIELPNPSFDADSSRTEIYNVPLLLASEQKLQNVSNKNCSADARSSKSLERNASSPLEPDSPTTPQPPPILPLHFQLSVEPRSFVDVSTIRPITSQASALLEDLPQLQCNALKSAAKSTISKIPVKKSASSIKDNSSQIAVTNQMNQRKSCVDDGFVEEPQISFPVSDRRGTFVLHSLSDNVIGITDRRNTFVFNSLPDNTKTNEISDRRATYFVATQSKEQADVSPPKVVEPCIPVQNTARNRATYFVATQSKEQADTSPPKVVEPCIPVQNTAPNRATYFVLPESKEQPDISPPKVIETGIPVLNAAPNQTILLCEDMELTEILPPQNQSHQFIPVVPHWSEKLETKEPGLNENLPASVMDQPSCTTSFVKQFPNSHINANINSTKQFQVKATHGVVKDAQIPGTASVKKNGDNELLASNILSKTKLVAEASVPIQDVNLTHPQQKRKESEKKLLKKEDIDTNIKCFAKKPPSPIAYYAKHDMSIQHKIFESFTSINTVSDKNIPTFDGTSVAEGDDHKEPTALTDSLLTNQPAGENVTVEEDAVSPKTNRRSSRQQKKCFVNFFSDSEESVIDLDEDFMPEKRFSLKPGRKIINPNNNKVFVFKKNSKKQYAEKDTPTEPSPDKSDDKNIKNDIENDVFDFSASSDADKSPLVKNKKRKSVRPKSNKHSVNKKSDAGKRSLKTSSKRSSKSEVNKDEVPVVMPPRKSILNLNRGNSPMPGKKSLQLSRKSVRFTLVGVTPEDEINNSKCDSPGDENITPVNKESDEVHVNEPVLSLNTRGSQNKRLSSKKYSSAGSSSFKATGDILKSSSAKPKRSRKRRSSDFNSDSSENVCETDCSPKKKMLQVPNNTPPQNIETLTDLSCGKQDKSRDRFENSQGISGAVSSEAPKEKQTGGKKEKKSGLPNLDANLKVTGLTDEVEKADDNKVKRPFSGVSERRSNKKLSAVDDIFPSLDDALCEVVDEKIKKALNLVTDEPTEIYNVKEMAETVSNEDSPLIIKTSNQKSRSGKKKIVDEKIETALNLVRDEPTEIYNVKEMTETVSNEDSPVIIKTSNQKSRSGKKKIVDEKIETSLNLVRDEPTEIYNVKELTESVETVYNKDNPVIIKTSKQKKENGKKKSYKKSKTSSTQSKEKENTPSNADKKITLDVLSCDSNSYTLFGSQESMEKILKPKNSRKKKESVPLLQNDLKACVLASENEIESAEAVGSRSKRPRKVMSFKEPSLNSKMRR